MKDIAKTSLAELMDLLAKTRESLRSFRFGEAGSRTRNVRAGRESRKLIARILTELTKRNNITKN